MQLQPNTTLQGGKYRIERVLGQGGFGNTYAGYNTYFEERVAIKEFFMQGLNDRDKESGTVSVSIESNFEQFQEQREKFKKEAQRIRKLNNPHIIKVHDLFEENGTTYYVMDFIDGESLAERLKRTGAPMSEQEIQRILPQLLDALKTVHDAGIWHLDLKPANILIDKASNVKLIDFGASKQINAHKGGATTSTAISYTNGYAPREQMEQNYEKFGPWTDIYALGATLYTLLTNKRPPLPTDIDDDISEDKHLALPMSCEIAGSSLHDLILWMMSTNRNMRPQSIDEIMNKSKSLIDAPKQNTFLDEEDDEETIIVAPKKEDTISNITNKESKEKKKEHSELIKTPKTNTKNNLLVIIIIIIAFIAIVIFGVSYCSSNNNTEAVGSDSSQKTEDVDNTVSTIEINDLDTPLGQCRYIGHVDNYNRPNGDGEAYFKDGRYYKGNFEGGNFTGEAIFRYPNGDEFRGTFKNNSFFEGVYIIAEDGSCFKGTFKNGQPDKGAWYDRNGKVIN